MSKEHYISLITYVTNDRMQIVKLYPEQNAKTKFPRQTNSGIIYNIYCSKDGLIKRTI